LHIPTQEIADEVKGKKIWVSVDETTDVMGRMIGNVVVVGLWWLLEFYQLKKQARLIC